MTESYGWYCSACKLRYRWSVCNKEKMLCPSGHDLKVYGYWIYRKESGDGLRVKISKKMPDGRTLYLVDVFVFWKDIDEKVEELSYYNSDFKDLFHNAFYVSYSIGPNDWRAKCARCKKNRECKKWRSIWCEEYEPKENHSISGK